MLASRVRFLAAALDRNEATRSARSWETVQRLPHHVKLPGLDSGEIEQVVDEGQEHPALLFDRADIFMNLVWALSQERVLIQQLGKAEQRAQGRADLVADVGEKLALARLASSACSLARRIDSAASTDCSSRFCSVMSREMPRIRSCEPARTRVTRRNSRLM